MINYGIYLTKELIMMIVGTKQKNKITITILSSDAHTHGFAQTLFLHSHTLDTLRIEKNMQIVRKKKIILHYPYDLQNYDKYIDITCTLSNQSKPN